MSDLALKRDKESGLVIMDISDEESEFGYENQSSDDRSKVWLKQLQSLSKECKRGRVKDAKEGMFYHTGTGRLFEDGVEIVVCVTDNAFVEWKPKGAGFVSRGKKGDAKWIEAKKNGDETGAFPWPLDNGNLYVDTRYMMVLCPGAMDADPWEFGTFSISSTKMPPYKEIMDKCWRHRVLNKEGKKVRPPLSSIRMIMKSFDDGEVGREHSGLIMEFAVDNDIDKSLRLGTDPLYIAANKIREEYLEGTLKVDASSETGDEPGVRDADFELIDGKAAF